MERIGLVAGSGNFPAIFANEARNKGVKVIAFGIEGITAPDFGDFVDRIHWIDPAKFQIQKFAFTLIAERIKKIVLVGKIDKSLIFSRLRNNKDVSSVLTSAKDNMDYSILEEVTRRFAMVGIKVTDAVDFLKDLMPPKGVLTKRRPSKIEEDDIEFGMRIAKEIARLDIGQTVAIKNKAVIAVEAIESTDDTIKRAGSICGGDFVIVKVSRPGQDMRWDVPLVGLKTLETMIEAGAKALAIESEKMFFVEKEKVIEEADLKGIAIVVV